MTNLILSSICKKAKKERKNITSIIHRALNPQKPYYFVLFDEDSSIPIHAWKSKHQPLDFSFISSAKLSAQNYGASSAIVYVTSQQEVFLLEEFKFSQDTEKMPEKPQRELFIEPSNFEALYGKTTTRRQEKVVENTTSYMSKALSFTNSLFDAPSHVLPPVSSLYKSFMDTLVQKNTEIKFLQTEKSNTDVMEIEENKTQQFKQKQLSDLDGEFDENKYYGMLDFFGSMDLRANKGDIDSTKDRPRTPRKNPRTEDQTSTNGKQKKSRTSNEGEMNGLNGHENTDNLKTPERKSKKKTPKSAPPKKSVKTKTQRPPNSASKKITTTKDSSSEEEELIPRKRKLRSDLSNGK